MKKTVFLFGFNIFLILAGCSETQKAVPASESTAISLSAKTLTVNGEMVDLHPELMKVLQPENPQTVKSVIPEETPQYTFVEKEGEKETIYKLWKEGNQYLLLVKKGEETIWTALEGEAYETAQEFLQDYQNWMIEDSLQADSFIEAMELSNGNIQIEPVSDIFSLKKNHSFVENENMYQMNENDILYIYETKNREDAKKVYQLLSTQLETIDTVSPPSLYQHQNLVILYLSQDAALPMKKTIEETIQRLQ